MEIENYFFNVSDEVQKDRVFVLVIYDIMDNKKRVNLAKKLQGYGVRVQKSAFEAMIDKKKYKKMLEELRKYVSVEDGDSIRIYKIIGKGQVTSYGNKIDNSMDDVIVI